MMTSTVATIIQAVSPVSSTGTSSCAPANAGSMARAAIRIPRAHREVGFEARSMRICDSQLFLSGRCSGLAGADSNSLFKIANKNGPVAVPARTRDVGNGFEHRFDDGVVHGDLDLGTRPVLCFIYFSHRHALHPELGDGVPHLVQLEGPDDRSDDFHDVHVATRGALCLCLVLRTLEPSGSAPTGPVQNPCHGSRAVRLGPLGREGAAPGLRCTVV